MSKDSGRELLTDIYRRLEKNGYNQHQLRDFLKSKLPEIKALLLQLRQEGKKLNMDSLVQALNIMAEKEGLRRRQDIIGEDGKKKGTTFFGVKVTKKELEGFLKEQKELEVLLKQVLA